MKNNRLWLWKNFVNGRPEYWAFDNPFPCYDSQYGDPMTLGEPCGYAIFKQSFSGNPDYSENEVLAAINQANAKMHKDSIKALQACFNELTGFGKEPNSYQKALDLAQKALKQAGVL